MRLLIVAALLCVATATYTPTLHGFSYQFADHSVELAVEGMLSFRVSVSYDGTAASMIDSPMIDAHSSYAAFTITSSGTQLGLKTSFGEARIDTSSGAFVLVDSQGKTISSTPQLSTMSSTASIEGKSKTDTCQTVHPGTDASGGRRTPGCPNGLSNQSQDSCCAACNQDSDCSLWVFAPGTSGTNCWLLMDVVKRVNAGGRTTGGDTLPGPSIITWTLGRNDSAQFYGAGSQSDSPATAKSSTPFVDNTRFFVPHYWSTEGYAAVGVSNFLFDPTTDANHYPASWTWSSGTAGSQTTWSVVGKRSDLYLMPAATAYDHMKAYWDLTGKPRVPPKYAFGFLACRWGWSSAQYIHDTLSQFRSGNFPIDGFISDFEWYTPEPDYSLPVQGSPTFLDWTYNNVTFPDPVSQLTDYHTNFNVRFGGIRKPRLGNSDLLTMAKAKGWLLPNQRNLNYTITDVQDYYQEQLAHFHKDGVDFWWNDEGETQYFTFHYWNLAQTISLAAYDPTRRFFTINRSYSPGMQRMGATVWTGDIPVNWDALARTPNYQLNWGMAGVSYVTCDIGGFNGGDTDADLLVRWYQLGTFLGVMRVHSSLNNKPHWPFLYGDVAAHLMQAALNRRYQFMPYIYSLAHAQYTDGAPIMRNLIYDFPNDQTAAGISTQWLVGSSVLAAPVVRQDSSIQVYLPAAVWFDFSAATVHSGPTTLSLSNLGLDVVPTYVRAGSIIPLSPVLQHTGQAPGGPLQVQVYAGADAAFTMVEDDGYTNAYEKNTGDVVRRISFVWSNASRTLSWTVAGSFTDAHVFTQLQVFGFFADGSKPTSTVVAIGLNGQVTI